MTTRTPSSSIGGFFQELPRIPPLYTSPDCFPASDLNTISEPKIASDDKTFARVLALYLPIGEQEPRRTVHNLARRSMDPELLAHSVDAETNHPRLRPFTTFGQRNKSDPLWTTAGWKALKAVSHEAGLISAAYDKKQHAWNRRVQQFSLNHAFICTATMVGCPIAMTDGAAKLLEAYLEAQDGDQPGLNHVVRESYRRLISKEPREAWTCGQWMTERAGGSDVSGTETFARRLTPEELAEDIKQNRHTDAHGLPLGPWRIDGFKWFSSATDSDMAIMLAQTEKGLSLFYAPMRRYSPSGFGLAEGSGSSELNGIRIQRLKDKLGTRSLPTAELELEGVRSYLLGEEGKGVKGISTILNMTRLYTAHSGVGYWARGLQICRAHSKVRKVRGGFLQDNQQHVRWMANETVKYAAATHFTFFGVALFGLLEQLSDKTMKPTKSTGLLPGNERHISILLRLLTPVMKAQVSLASVAGLREAMECLGGVGYCENNEDGGLFNIARLFRDSLVGPIWEGTVSVMAEDVVRVLTDARLGEGKAIDTIFGPWVRQILHGCQNMLPEDCGYVISGLDDLQKMVRSCSKEELLFRGREILQLLEAITCSVLLIFDACIDNDEVAIEIARRWTRSHTRQQPQQVLSWSEAAAMDLRIFLGRDAGLSVPVAGRL